jgi:hypothetical protein
VSLQRRAELRRTPLARKPAGQEPRHASPQRSGTLRRTGGLARGAGLRARSDRTARQYVTRRALVAALLAQYPWCQVRWDSGCQGRSADVHEPALRSRGADILSAEACICACRHCIHANPAEATRRGFLLPSGRPPKAVARRAPVMTP